MEYNSFTIRFFPVLARTKSNNIPIYCRITINRKKAEFFTQVFALSGKWDAEQSRVRGQVELNAILVGIEAKLRRLYNSALLEERKITAHELKSAYFGKDQAKQTLLSYYDQFEKEIAELTDQYSKATLKKYSSIKVHLESFLTEKKQTNISFSAFKNKEINEFEYYLRTRAKLNINTTTKYLKQIKAVFNRGFQFGIIKENPFLGFKFKTENTHRTVLNKDELELIEKFKTTNQSLERINDCFVFSCNTGLRYSDLNSLTPNNIITNKKGETWLTIQMQKTGEPLNIPLTKKAVIIIKKYKEFAESTGQLLPVISNQKINVYLKAIADLVGIKKVLTFHVARHTFATTVTLSNKIPIEVVSKLLGHKNLRTTQDYAKITNDYLSDSINQLNKIHGN